MIKKVSYTILSLFLLVTTVGLTINFHYCNGNLYSYGIDTKAENCDHVNGHMKQAMNMNHKVMFQIYGSETDSCNNETTFVKISDYFTNTVQEISISNNFVSTPFRTLYEDETNLFTSYKKETNFDNTNNNWPGTGQFLSLIQSFLL
ncbi:MAG: hypothetical protein GXO79_15215 [Chlorobi bacterium]|nr:hypothetical protein [Chlorobiota bacterium]